MNARQLTAKLAVLKAQRPVTVLGAAVIDVIADAYALPWRGCDIAKAAGVNIGGCALNIAIALKGWGSTRKMRCRRPRRVGGYYPQRLAKEDLHSAIEGRRRQRLVPGAGGAGRRAHLYVL
jgi:hypothetical protein